MLRRLYDWTMGLARRRHADKALAAVSFAESSVFPIPPDVLLIPMVLARRQRWAYLATICTIASVLGAFLGYAIGALFMDIIGDPILRFYGKEDSFERIQILYNQWGGWGVFFAALTPFPYKVLTIFSGATGLNFAVFTIVSIIGRAGRFFLVAWLLGRYGEPLQRFIDRWLNWLFLAFVLLLVGGFLSLKFVF